MQSFQIEPLSDFSGDELRRDEVGPRKPAGNSGADFSMVITGQEISLGGGIDSIDPSR